MQYDKDAIIMTKCLQGVREQKSPPGEDQVLWLRHGLHSGWWVIFFIIIDRFELSSHYISWKFFWQISYRKDTLLKGAPNNCWKRRESN